MKSESSALPLWSALILPVGALAGETPHIDGEDTAWMIVATAFVMLMTPAGLALFYGGMSRRKNVLNTIDMSLIAFAVGTLVWVVAVMLGRRRDYGKVAIKPFSPVLTVMDAALLWFGWFGFNAGSAVAADASLVTNVAAALGVFGWLAAEYLVYRKSTLVGGASGAVAGLVAITPASGSAGALGAVIIGLVGGVLGFFGVSKIKKLFRVDDSLDAFWVHGLVGIWGSIATALFVAPYLKPENFKRGRQLIAQFEAIVMTALVFLLSGALTGGGRVDDETEFRGLDEMVHGEEALNL